MNNELDQKIDQWFADRGITENGKPLSQAVKTLEEVTEMFDALNKNSMDELVDAVGDVYVTLRGVCLTSGVNMEECIESAYNEIKDRKGYLSPEGIFIKET